MTTHERITQGVISWANVLNKKLAGILQLSAGLDWERSVFT